MDAITQNKSNKFMQNFSSYEKIEKQSFYTIQYMRENNLDSMV